MKFFCFRDRLLKRMAFLAFHGALVTFATIPASTTAAHAQPVPAMGCNQQAINYIVYKTNQFRRNLNLPELTLNSGLTWAAQRNNRLQAINTPWGWSHNVYDAEYRYGVAGFTGPGRSWGENVAFRYWWGTLNASQIAQMDSRGVFRGWYESPPHYANMADPNHRFLGVACDYRFDGTYNKIWWTQSFGS